MKKMNLQNTIFGMTVLLLCQTVGWAASGRRARCDEKLSLQGDIRTFSESQEILQGEVAALRNALNSLSDMVTSSLPEDCSAAKARGAWSTTALVRPPGLPPRMVRCDQYEDNGGWTVILARRPTTQERINFNTTWQQYKDGFGDIEGEFWIGNEVLHALTKEVPHHMRVVITDWKGISTTATWLSFTVNGEDDRYRLHIDGYLENSTAGNALLHHNRHAFSTHDTDNDVDQEHCAQRYGGGWWYSRCYTANPTGTAFGPNQVEDHGIIWRPDRFKISLRSITMMIRPSQPASYYYSHTK